ncbi:MAG TPA: FMN-binding protein [Planctomycetaceae bacterium]|nr:FMN-binding protein [Planctomycetaceae bacterium]
MNRNQRLPLTVAAILALLALSSRAAAEEKIDPTGAWSLKVTRPGRPPQESILKLEKNGDQLVGAITDSQGRTGSIKDVQLKGDEISFRVEVEREGQKFSFAYKGKLTKDALKGTVAAKMFGRDMNLDFDGKRMKENTTLAGSWHLSMAFAGGGGQGGRPRRQGAQPGGGSGPQGDRPRGAGGGGGGGGGRGQGRGGRGALTRQIMLSLKDENGKISGDFVGFTGKPTAIQDVKFKDGELSFKVPQEMGPNKVTITFVAKLVGEKMQGTAKIAMPFGTREMPFQGDRMKASAETAGGTWKLKVPLKEGPAFEPTLKLTQSGTTLQGVYVGEHGETPLENAVIFGDEVSFDVARDRDGKKFRLHYQGKLKGNALSGSVDYDFDGMTGYATFTGDRATAPAPQASAAKP